MRDKKGEKVVKNELPLKGKDYLLFLILFIFSHLATIMKFRQVINSIGVLDKWVTS